MESTLMKHLLTMALLAASTFASVADPLGVPDGWASGTTGGAGGGIDTARDSTALAKPGPGLVFVEGTVSGQFQITTGSKSLLGLPGAVIRGSLTVSGTKTSFLRNVIVRNLTLIPGKTCTGDFGVGTCEDEDEMMRVSYARGIWLDHLTLTDGLYSNLNILHGSDSLTLSWIRQSFTRTDSSRRFANMIGGSDRNGAEDSLRLRFSWHHSLWGENLREWMPRVRFGNAHLYNNVFSSKTVESCIRAGTQSSLLVEANLFDGTSSAVSFWGVNAIAELRLNRFVDVTSDTVGNGKAIAPPYTASLDPVAGLEALVTPLATGAGANLTWKDLPTKPVSLSPSRAGQDFEISHRAGRVVLRNLSTEAQAVEFLSVSGRILSPRVALAPGSSCQVPGKRGIRFLRSRSLTGSRITILPISH
jgi:pectate lyase